MSTSSTPTRNIPRGDTSPSGGRHVRVPRPTSDSLRAIAWRLESRDYVLAHLLDEHRTLTCDQISAVLFASPRTCRNRLDKLRRLGYVDWFIPVRHGRRLPAHWVPGLLAARYVALSRGERPPTPSAVRQLQDRLVASTHLGHIDGTNQFGIDLLRHARSDSGCDLVRWWSGARIAAACGGRVRPDAHGVWRTGGHYTPWYLEWDSGTERLAVLTAKLAAYQRLREAGGPGWPVLFWLPTSAREANLHRKLAAMAPLGVEVATTAADRVAAVACGPTGAVWKLAGNGRRRLTLSELPARVGDVGPYHPGPATAEQDPLYLLRQP